VGKKKGRSGGGGGGWREGYYSPLPVCKILRQTALGGETRTHDSKGNLRERRRENQLPSSYATKVFLLAKHLNRRLSDPPMQNRQNYANGTGREEGKVRKGLCQALQKSLKDGTARQLPLSILKGWRAKGTTPDASDSLGGEN